MTEGTIDAEIIYAIQVQAMENDKALLKVIEIMTQNIVVMADRITQLEKKIESIRVAVNKI